MKPIIIYNKRDLSDRTDDLFYPLKDLYQANIVIVKTPTHFRCIKNSWEETTHDEKIPNKLLMSYLMEYEQYFTKEDLFNCIIHYRK